MRSIARRTSANEVVSGESPRRIESGARKSGITPARDHPAGQVPRVGTPDRDVRPAPRGLARAPEGEPRAAPARRHGARSRIRSGRSPSPGSGRSPPRPPAGSPPRRRRAPRIPGVPVSQPAIPGWRPEPWPISNWSACAEPALDRVAQLGLEIGPDVEVRRRPGAAVQVLVRAADGEVDAVLGKPDRDRTAGVRQVPHDEGAGIARESGDRRQVGDRRGPVVDVAQGDERDVVLVRASAAATSRHCRPVDHVGVEPGDVPVSIPREALQHVAVGREVRPVGDDEPPAGPGIEGRAREPVEVDRRRIADRDLVRPRAEDLRPEQVADPARLARASAPSRGSARRPTPPGRRGRPARSPPEAAGRASCRRGRGDPGPG